MPGPKLKQWAWGAYTPEGASSASPGGEPAPVMSLPPGGAFLCSYCKYLSEDGKRCGSAGYQAHMGTDVLPKPADQMCSKWFEDKEGRDLALGPVADAGKAKQND